VVVFKARISEGNKKMRIIGFSKKWGKLRQPIFTTFRFPRKDKDWQRREIVQVVYLPRSPRREILGIAEIISIEPRCMAWHGSKLVETRITNKEANADGFPDEENKKGYFLMWEWLFGIYGGYRLMSEAINKLTLKWQESPE